MTSACLAGTMACLLVIGEISANMARSAAGEAVIGLWTYATTFPVSLAGELTITRQGGAWQGSIAGASAAARASAGEVRIAFSREGDLFRGYLDRDGRLERGFWVRREMTDDARYPEGAAQGYAMPLALHSRAPTAGRRR